MEKKRTFKVAELDLAPLTEDELGLALGAATNSNCGGCGDTGGGGTGGGTVGDDDGGGGGWCTWYCPWYPPE